MTEGLSVQYQQRINLVAGQREHDGRAVRAADWVVIHGQQGKGLAVAKPFPGDVVVRCVVRHHAHQHAAAEIMHVGRDAHGASRCGKAAVGGDQQARVQRAAAGQAHMGTLRIGAHTGHLFAREQRDVVVGLLCPLHGFEGGSANQVVGHQPAQLAVLAQAMADHHCEWRRAIEHPRIAQGRQGIWVAGLDTFPQAERAHELRRVLGERNLAPIESGLFDGGQRLLLYQRYAQAVPRKCTRQAQPGRTSARDEDVKVHAGQRSIAGSVAY